MLVFLLCRNLETCGFPSRVQLLVTKLILFESVYKPRAYNTSWCLSFGSRQNKKRRENANLQHASWGRIFEMLIWVFLEHDFWRDHISPKQSTIRIFSICRWKWSRKNEAINELNCEWREKYCEQKVLNVPTIVWVWGPSTHIWRRRLNENAMPRMKPTRKLMARYRVSNHFFVSTHYILIAHRDSTLRKFHRIIAWWALVHLLHLCFRSDGKQI